MEEAFQRHREHFSVKREEGARTIKGGDWGDLFTARKLRVNVMGEPVPSLFSLLSPVDQDRGHLRIVGE